jgi:sec-independent protein translocase protein TatA
MLGPIGITEMVIIVVIALLVFGPKKLPSLGKSLAEGITSFKKGISGRDSEGDRVQKSKDGSDGS